MGRAPVPVVLNGRFDLFSHHVYAGDAEGSPRSTLWLAVLAAPLGNTPVTPQLLAGSTSLSQATGPGQTQALPAPAEPDARNHGRGGGRTRQPWLEICWAGCSAAELTNRRWTLAPGTPTQLPLLPIPVAGLDPLLNGCNLQLRFHSSGPVKMATLAAHGEDGKAPSEQHAAAAQGPAHEQQGASTHPRGSKGKIIYSRVSGVVIGSSWRARITDPDSLVLAAPTAPISWPISSLERGTLATKQVQTAELKRLSRHRLGGPRQLRGGI